MSPPGAIRGASPGKKRPEMEWTMRLLVRQLERVMQIVVCDLATETQTRSKGKGIVQPSPSPCVTDLLEQIIRGREVLHRVQIPCRSRGIETVDIKVDFVCSENLADYLDHR